MATYKIGNKVQGIIRSYSTGELGSMNIQYKNQPYMLLKDIQATLTFANDDIDIKINDKNHLSYNHDTVKSITLDNVLINDKLLDLLYQSNTNKLFAKHENYVSDSTGWIYFNFPTDVVYQLFIYDNTNTLVAAYGTYNSSSIQLMADKDYSVYYQYLGTKSFLLNKTDNNYVTLDLEVIGNEDEGTQTMSIHIEKCLIKANKNMYFNNNSINTMSLTAVVIYTGEDYITLK